jgi:lipopolysaccharide transport system ATP-binding protein
MSQLAIQVENLSKSYPIGRTGDRPQQGERRFGYQLLSDGIADAIVAPLRRLGHLRRGQGHDPVSRSQQIWALRDLSFAIRHGEVVGIIGRNGAGKSTLLKILSRLTAPTRGEATIYGRVGSLLEVGTGFHPELTGRENIYLNGAILGMKRREILRCFDAIVAFAEVEPFIDTAVKHYSSGMYLRLAFAVAAHLEPEILLVDEVLAVGDAQFQKKCLGKMADVAQMGRTVFLVSHNMTAVSALCQRVLYLQDGMLAMDGETNAGIARYLADVETTAQTPLAERTDRTGNGLVRITELRWLDAKSRTPLTTVISGQELYLEASYAVDPAYQKPLTGLEINVSFRSHLDQFLFSLNSRMANNAFIDTPPVGGRLYCHVERLPLMPGRFWGTCTVKLNGENSDQIHHAFTTEVNDGDFFGTGVTYHWDRQGVYIPHRWVTALP